MRPMANRGAQAGHAITSLDVVGLFSTFFHKPFKPSVNWRDCSIWPGCSVIWVVTDLFGAGIGFGSIGCPMRLPTPPEQVGMQRPVLQVEQGDLGCRRHVIPPKWLIADCVDHGPGHAEYGNEVVDAVVLRDSSAHVRPRSGGPLHLR